MKIIKAENKDKEAIFDIWLSCFTEDEAYINTYLEYCFPNSTTLLLGDDVSGYVSVISIIPSYFIHNNQIIKGGYLYGVGTLPEHRGNSYSSKLIDYAKELLISEGFDYFIVKPATETLFSLYKRLGFNKEIYNTRITVKSPQDLSTETDQSSINLNTVKTGTTLDSEKLFQTREENLSSSCFLWPKEILSYSLREILNRDGFLFISDATGDYCTGYASEDSYTLLILETTVKPDVVKTNFGNQIKKRYPQSENWTIDYPYNANLNQAAQLSALIMELKPGIYERCCTLNLSLPME